MRVRHVTHVEGLMFSISQGEPLLCFVLPQAAVEVGQRNHTIPGGRILQLGGRRFEPVEVAMRREYQQETGAADGEISILSGIGAPRPHVTGRGEIKLVQGFAGIVTQPCNQPQFVDEIASVAWKTRDNWARTLATMNSGKQQLVLRLLQETMQLKRMYPCIKREVGRFLAQVSVNPKRLAA